MRFRRMYHAERAGALGKWVRLGVESARNQQCATFRYRRGMPRYKQRGEIFLYLAIDSRYTAAITRDCQSERIL